MLCNRKNNRDKKNDEEKKKRINQIINNLKTKLKNTNSN